MAIRQANFLDQPPPGAFGRPPVQRKRPAGRLVLHGLSLVLALVCFAAYGHLKLEGSQTAATVSLVLAAIFAFAPLRDVLRLVFRIEGTALHVAHGVGSLALIGLPVSGLITSTPVLSRAWMAPFALMGAAQAVMHQNQPRNAKQAAALQQFAASLPEVAQFASSDLSSPANARRAVAVLSDILQKAQALGETELQADPGFQSALSRASGRVGANLGLDAVELALRKLAQNPATVTSVPDLELQLASARKGLNK
jgi:hypothetical protein